MRESRRWRRLALAAVCGMTMPVALAGQAAMSVEKAIQDLRSADPGTRYEAALALKTAAAPAGAGPLAALVVDPDDDVQFEAIAAELNIFLAEPIVPRRRVGLLVERRQSVQAEAIFSAGPLALAPRPLPPPLLAALRTAVHDDNPRVGIEALYAFGVLGTVPGGAARAALLTQSGAELASLLGVADVGMRYGAARVIGRVWERRPGDPPIDTTLGDAVVSSLNDRDPAVRAAAIDALGSMRYERATTALTDLLAYHERGALAEAALDSLARIGHASSRARFVSLLGSKNAAFRASAFEGLGVLGDTSQRQAVESALATERNDAARLAGAFAASMLGNAPPDALVTALRQPRQRDRARDYLVGLARAGRLSSSAWLARDGQPRAALLDVIALARDHAVAPVVSPLASSPDADVARAAARTIAWLKVAATD